MLIVDYNFISFRVLHFGVYVNDAVIQYNLRSNENTNECLVLV